MFLRALQLALIFVAVLSISSAVADPVWTWNLSGPAANSSVTPYNPTSQFNLTITSAPEAALFIELDGNLTYAVLLDFGGSSLFFPAPSDSSVSANYNVTNATDLWTPLSVNVTLLDPSTNATTNYSTSIRASSWHGTLIPSYSLFIFPPLQDLFWTTSNEEESVFCQWDFEGQNQTSNKAEQLDSNTFTCPFYAPPLWRAGDPITMSVAICTLTSNDSYACQDLDGTVPFIQSALWNSVNQSELICAGQNITVAGTFYTDRYYTCIFCWNGDESSVTLAVSSLAHANGTAFTCTIDVLPDATTRTSTVDLCWVDESLQPALSFENTTYIPGPSANPYGLGAYRCAPKKSFWKFWMTIVAASVGGVLVAIAIFVALRLGNRGTPAERQPLRRNNADA